MHSAQPVHYLPIASTLVSALFIVALLRRATTRRWAPHLVWWAVGVLFYGLGTLVESVITLDGNTVLRNRLWYWAGAILGGYPLGTGSLYLLARRRTAHILTAASMLVVVTASVAVFLSPIDAGAIAESPHRPSGAFIGWQWVRLLTPFINLYAALFLIGGALYSTWVFTTRHVNPSRAAGTALIAAGGLLPGVGGSMAKAGVVEALYVGEFLGIILIWIGYALCIRTPPTGVSPAGAES